MAETVLPKSKTRGDAQGEPARPGDGAFRQSEGGDHAAPSLYALLGIAEFEADDRVIRQAIEDRLGHSGDRVAANSNRPNGDAAPTRNADRPSAAVAPGWERRALERAREILMNSEKKRQYDADLHRVATARGSAREDRARRPAPAVADEAPEASGGEAETVVAAAELVRCADCKKVNPTSARFCTQCGQPLWQTCLHCQQPAPLDARFCGHCGADLQADAEQQIEQLCQALDEAERWLDEHEFDKAIDRLGPVSRLDHPKLRPWVEKAVALLRSVAARRELARKQVTQRCELAAALRKAGRFDEAAATLESIPQSLRTSAVEAELADSRARSAEITALSAEVCAALRGEKVAGLLEKVGRLLALQPDHAEARHVAERLEGRVALEARRKIRQHEYDAAVAMLDRLPGSARSPEATKLRHYAAELAWLEFDALHQPMIDERLEHVGKRLAQLAPQHPRLPVILKRIERGRAERAAGGVGTNHGPSIRIAPSAGRAFDVPITWIERFQRIELPDDADPTMTAAPSRMFGAVGLALQGLGWAAVPMNLLSSEGRGLLGSVTAFMRSRTVRSALGLDVGTSAVKAVRLETDGRSSTPRVAFARLVPYRKPLGQAVNAAEEDELVAEAIAALKESGSLKGDRVCVALGSRWLLNYRLDLPPLDAKRLGKLIEFEVRSQTPVPVEQLYWDYYIGGTAADRETSGHDGAPAARSVPLSRPVLVAAMRRFHARRQLNLLEQAGVAIDALQIDILAGLGAISYGALDNSAESPPPSSGGPSLPLKQTIAVVDIGADTAMMLVAGPRCIWLRHLGTVGQSFTRALVQQENLRLDQAETLKCQLTSARSIARVQASLNPVLEQLAGEIRNLLAAHAENDPDEPIEKLYLVGGGTMLYGLARYLCHGR